MESENIEELSIQQIISLLKRSQEVSAVNNRSPVRSRTVSRTGSRTSSQNSGTGSMRQSLPKEKIQVTFIFPLEKKYECPMCKDVLRYPVQLGCGHRVCSACLPELIRIEPRCPIDQTAFDTVKGHTIDLGFNREILQLDVKCNRHEWGCKWEGEFQHAQQHEEACLYVDTLCTHDCGSKFQKRFLEKHLNKDCPRKIIACPYCDDRHLRQDRKAHLDECAKLPLPCPNKCEKFKLVISRDQLDHHIEEECPKTKINCEYEEIGCCHRSNREKLPKHYKGELASHVRLLYGVVMEQKKSLEEAKAQLANQAALIRTQEQRIEDLGRITHNQLIWRIEDYQRKFKLAKSGELDTIDSPDFYTSKHGYRLMASTCLNGYGKGKGTHMSIFISVLQGTFDALLKWPYVYRTTFYLLDQNEDLDNRKHIKFSVKPNPCRDNEPFLGRPRTMKNPSFGGAKFASHEDIKKGRFIKDNCIFIKIAVECAGRSEP